MKVLSGADIATAFARETKQHVLFLQFDANMEEPIDELQMAAPYLDLEFDKLLTLVWAGFAIVVCESADELQNLFDRTAGDDPAKLNTYKGPLTIYAMMIDDNGQPISENT